MTQRKERPIWAPDDLLSVNDVADLLRLASATVYRLAARRRISSYRLPGGLRFKMKDVDEYRESLRSAARDPKQYGDPEDQG